ncbi:ArgE/DapE family deacylase [Fructilactobacillus myrtifloralis]|uniref:Probable succinyl-diaminopimelate desuccinylase n=1 Tax=Fructilactobacillus myrtifloralis TaxID=2940301 RepID=A0ABY5BMY9_9LACO|nr:ArgE/DapE family deacylase [Fructilactobacillus myrtifloralis]USS85032.1 ArgE/DapE family deacylase [Fructilactobacillus myrtifloralis]
MNPTEKIQLLADLVAIQSVNDHEAEVADYLSQVFAKHDIATHQIEYAPGRANLVAEIGQGNPVTVFSGHADVVAAGGDWDTDPFVLTEKNGKLYGRGACDMKSSLAAMVIAMIDLKESQTPLPGTVRFLLTVGEEVGEYGAEQLTNQGYMDDATALIIGEPTGYQICYAHKGSLDVQIEAKGKVAHSSMPQLGNNAVQNLLELLTIINQRMSQVHATDPATGDFLFNFTVLSGGDQVNSIPGTATVALNARTIDEFDNAAVLDTIQSAVNQLQHQASKYQFDVRVLMNLPPVDGQAENQLVKRGQQVGEQVSGHPISTFGGTYTTDAAKFLVNQAADFPFMIFGPGNQSLHSANEYIDKQMYFNFIDIYRQLMLNNGVTTNH